MQIATRRPGFTLMEMLLVIGIIGLLMTLVITGYQGIRDWAGKQTVRAKIKEFEGAIFRYHSDTNTYPRAWNDLMKRPTEEHLAKKWSGPYIEEIPDDPWGNPYVYHHTPSQPHKYELYSEGPNGAEGTKEERIGIFN